MKKIIMLALCHSLVFAAEVRLDQKPREHVIFESPDEPTILDWFKSRSHLNLEALDFAEWTPLMKATERGYKKAAEELLKLRANVNTQSVGGETSLHLAIRHNRPELLTLLLQAKADPKLKTCMGATPYDYAKTYERPLMRRVLAPDTDDRKEPAPKNEASRNIDRVERQPLDFLLRGLIDS